MRCSDSPRFATLMRRVGVLGALERLPRVRGLLVLNYHRVGDFAANPFDDGTFSASVDGFRAHVRYLKRRFAMPPVAEVLESLARGRLDDPTALLTFDDGYRDNYEDAFPVLRDLGVPACFFVVTGLIDAPRLPWWDVVAYSVKRTAVDVVRLQYPQAIEIDMRATSRVQAIWRILRAYKDARAIEPARFFDELARETRVDVDAEALGQTLFMTWERARAMERAGMTIGSHTSSHPVLASLSEATQRAELEDSRERIREMLGSPADVLAYPVGGPSAFTDLTKRIARDVGYRAAFRYHGGLNRMATIDPYAIARVEVEHTHTWTQFRLRTTLGGLDLLP